MIRQNSRIQKEYSLIINVIKDGYSFEVNLTQINFFNINKFSEFLNYNLYDLNLLNIPKDFRYLLEDNTISINITISENNKIIMSNSFEVLNLDELNFKNGLYNIHIILIDKNIRILKDSILFAGYKLNTDTNMSQYRKSYDVFAELIEEMKDKVPFKMKTHIQNSGLNPYLYSSIRLPLHLTDLSLFDYFIEHYNPYATKPYIILDDMYRDDGTSDGIITASTTGKKISNSSEYTDYKTKEQIMKEIKDGRDPSLKYDSEWGVVIYASDLIKTPDDPYGLKRIKAEQDRQARIKYGEKYIDDYAEFLSEKAKEKNLNEFDALVMNDLVQEYPLKEFRENVPLEGVNINNVNAEVNDNGLLVFDNSYTSSDNTNRVLQNNDNITNYHLIVSNLHDFKSMHHVNINNDDSFIRNSIEFIDSKLLIDKQEIYTLTNSILILTNPETNKQYQSSPKIIKEDMAKHMNITTDVDSYLKTLQSKKFLSDNNTRKIKLLFKDLNFESIQLGKIYNILNKNIYQDLPINIKYTFQNTFNEFNLFDITTEIEVINGPETILI